LSSPIDPRSPQGREARATAQNLIAAHHGGLSTYTSEFNSYFGGIRPQNRQSNANLLHIVDALVTIADTLVWVATVDVSEESQEVQEMFNAMTSDREELLLRLDDVIDFQLRYLGEL
jgi:hypothetical protein